jgi:hypothetical protein
MRLTALNLRAASLRALDNREEAISVIDELIRDSDCGPEAAPALREQVASALSTKAVMLEELGRADEAVIVYEVLVRQFDRSETATIGTGVERAAERHQDLSV